MDMLADQRGKKEIDPPSCSSRRAVTPQYFPCVGEALLRLASASWMHAMEGNTESFTMLNRHRHRRRAVAICKERRHWGERCLLPALKVCKMGPPDCCKHSPTTMPWNLWATFTYLSSNEAEIRLKDTIISPTDRPRSSFHDPIKTA